MSDLLGKIGERIRSLRKGKGLSQQDLAEKAGISYKYLGEIERGQVNLSVEILDKIAKALPIESGALLAQDSGYSKEISQALLLLTEFTPTQQTCALAMLKALDTHFPQSS